MERVNNIIMNDKLTDFYIFNEDGILNENEIMDFCNFFKERTMFDVTLLKAESLGDRVINVFAQFIHRKFEFVLFNSGYVMKYDGDILSSMLFLYDFDRILPAGKSFYVSPTQRLETIPELLFKRGAKLDEIAIFLDRIFHNDLYSKELNQKI